MTWNNWSKWCLLVAGMNIGLAASGLWHVGFQPGHILNIAIAVLLMNTPIRVGDTYIRWLLAGLIAIAVLKLIAIAGGN